MATSSISVNPASKQKRPSHRRTHGKTNSPEYGTYHRAIRRCRSPEDVNFSNYGGRGIEFRFASFEEFYAEVGDRPSSEHSLDRIDTNGHYEKGNVRWATLPEQRRNQRRVRRICLDGQDHCLAEWAAIYNIIPNTIFSRLVDGWCERCAVTVPVRGRGCHHKRFGVPREKLTADNVREIRRRLASGTPPSELAVLYGVTKSTISRVKLGILWNSVPQNPDKQEINDEMFTMSSKIVA